MYGSGRLFVNLYIRGHLLCCPPLLFSNETFLFQLPEYEIPSLQGPIRMVPEIVVRR
jgi:hypothetical protein